MLKVGDDSIAARVVSARAPPEYSPLAIGAAQLTHTPSGAPIASPNAEFAKAPRKLARRK